MLVTKSGKTAGSGCKHEPSYCSQRCKSFGSVTKYEDMMFNG